MTKSKKIVNKAPAPPGAGDLVIVTTHVSNGSDKPKAISVTRFITEVIETASKSRKLPNQYRCNGFEFTETAIHPYASMSPFRRLSWVLMCGVGFARYGSVTKVEIFSVDGTVTTHEILHQGRDDFRDCFTCTTTVTKAL